MAYYEDLPVGKLTLTGGGSVGTLAAVSGLSVAHKIMGPLVVSTFTLTDVAQAVVNGTEYQSTKLFTFPACHLVVNNVFASIAQKTTSAIASTLNSGVTGALGLGSAAASNVSLTGTMVNMLPTTAFVTSTVINVAAAASAAVLAAPATLDGSATAKDMYINTAYATTTDVDADATQTLTGTIIVAWINLG